MKKYQLFLIGVTLLLSACSKNQGNQTDIKENTEQTEMLEETKQEENMEESIETEKVYLPLSGEFHRDWLISEFENGTALVGLNSGTYLISEEGEVLISAPDDSSTSIRYLEEGYFLLEDMEAYIDYVYDNSGELLTSISCKDELNGIFTHVRGLVNSQLGDNIVCNIKKESLDKTENYIGIYDFSGNLIAEAPGTYRSTKGDKINVEINEQMFSYKFDPINKTLIQTEYEKTQDEILEEEIEALNKGVKDSGQFGGSNGTLNEGLKYGYYKFYNTKLEVVMDISEYPEDKYLRSVKNNLGNIISQDGRGPIFRNEYLGLNLYQDNGNGWYYTIYSNSGQKLFEPKRGQIYNNIIDEKYITWGVGDDMVRCLGLDGTIYWEIPGEEVFSVSDNIICLGNKDTCAMYDWDGNFLFDSIWYEE